MANTRDMRARVRACVRVFACYVLARAYMFVRMRVCGWVCVCVCGVRVRVRVCFRERACVHARARATRTCYSSPQRVIGTNIFIRLYNIQPRATRRGPSTPQSIPGQVERCRPDVRRKCAAARARAPAHARAHYS